MTETDQPNIETLIVWHGNRGLFSDYYLDHILPYFDAWKDSVRGCTAFLVWLQELYAQEQANLDHYSEEQLERHWFRPILAQLGHVYETQAPIPGLQDDQAKRPDYVFFLDEAARQAALPHHGTAEYARQALAVAEVKKWQVSLSKKSRSHSALFTDLNPMWQLDYYLRATGLKWGFVSNGRVWRLMHGDSSYKLSQYYEVDLIALMLTKDIHKLQYFYLFFHQNAFKPDEHGVILLNMVLQGSRDYAIGVEKDLRENAYLALEQLMQGFLEVRQNKLGAADVMAIYQNSLYLLYRLLFILYAESQNLLPLYDAGYRKDYSLRELEFPLTWRDTFVNGRKYWDHVRRLFDIINGTDPDFNLELGLPRYNGGLFDPIQHAFLEKYRVGDRAFVTALRLLSQRTFNGIPQKVDYRALGVRQLGSIYEGLLEYQPRYATEKMVVVRSKNGEQWQPAVTVKSADKLTAERRAPGQIYLATDKGERKSTGSYYTPEYVVQYMVEQTLNPLLDELRNVTDLQSFGERVLQLKILDPAMGSGHFLVAVADYLALVIVAEPSMAIETEIEAAQLAWKRRVVEWSLYGVDKNPLAVELAKLSLWLSTVARDKPLNFLDHHLQCGDALVGAQVADLGDVPLIMKPPKMTGQRNLFEQRLNEKLPLMLSEMWQLLQRESDSYEAVHAKDALYRAMQQVKAPFEAVANLWVSGYFGHDFTPTEYDEAIDLITQPDKLFALPAMQTAQALAETHHFFHWELVFPEVFFDLQGQPLATPGFSMVISNPPYVRQETLGAYKLFFQQRYEVYHGVADLYVYFYERGIKLLRNHGWLCYISSGTFAKANFGSLLRKWLPTVAQIKSLIDFGENQPFAGAEMVRPSITLFQKTRGQKPFLYLLIQDKMPEFLDLALKEEGIECSPDIFDQAEWAFQSSSKTHLFDKIFNQGERLVDFVNGKMFYGIKTGFNDAFIINQSIRDHLIHQDVNSTHLIKPLIRGADLRPWYQTNENQWLIFTRNGINLKDYPAIEAHLLTYKAQLEPRPVNWSTNQPWPGRKPGPYQWFELQDTVNYFAEFETPKIFYPEIAKLPRFSWDDQNKYILNSGFIITATTPYLLAILQSRVTWFCISQICQPLRLRAGLWQYNLYTQYTSRLPIPNVSTNEQQRIGDIAMQITTQAQARYQLHRRSYHRIMSDLGLPNRQLNQKLTKWWGLNFKQFREQIILVFKGDIPLKQRDDWEEWLTYQTSQHKKYSSEIIRLEIMLNQNVYELFNLNLEEIKVIEESTKYLYGEV